MENYKCTYIECSKGIWVALREHYNIQELITNKQPCRCAYMDCIMHEELNCSNCIFSKNGVAKVGGVPIKKLNILEVKTINAVREEEDKKNTKKNTK